MVRRAAARRTFSFIVFSTWLDRLVNAALRFGVQSNSSSNGNFYSSSMFFDSEIERLHITGTSYDDTGRRSCFMGSLQLPELSDDRGPTWVNQKDFGSENSSLTCSSIFMAKYQGIRTYFLLGYSETFPDFVPNLLEQESATRPDMYGLTMELNYAAELYGGSVQLSDRVQYPLAVIGNSSDGQGLFVATAHASTPISGSSYQKYLYSQHLLQPDPEVTGAFLPPKFEKGCSVTLSSFVQTQLNGNTEQVSMSNSSSEEEYSNLQKTWTKELRSREGDSVFFSGMAKHPHGELLVAGYTAGTGPDFGSSTRDGSIDSFVTSLNPVTGSTLQSMRLQSVSNSTDIILGICTPQLNSSTFYVVGMTNEQSEENRTSNSSFLGAFKSFVLKLDLRSFSLVWSTEIKGIPATVGGTGDVMAISCAVTKDNAVVYVGGTVKNGATLSLDGQTSVTNSSGGDDIFVAKVRVDNGTVAFVRQIGTEKDDRMAYGNSLMTDNRGNALVLGNTRGSMFRMKMNDTDDDASDFVVFSLDRVTGNYMELESNVFNASNATSNMTAQFNQSDLTESHEETYPTNVTTATLRPSPSTTFRHSTIAPTVVHVSNSTKMNSTIANTTTANQTSGSSANNGKHNSSSLPHNSSSGGQDEDTPPMDDTILIASIAMLIVVIVFSCATLSFLRYKRKHNKKGTSTIWDAKGGDRSDRYGGGNAGEYEGESAQSSGDRIRYRATRKYGVEQFDARSHVSGETLVSSPNPIRLDPETLLRLDPSNLFGSFDGNDNESYVSQSRDSDSYHPSVSLDSVLRSQNRRSTVKSNGRSCLSSGRTSQSRSQKSIRFSDAASIQSESVTSFSDGSDELPGETVDPSEYHTFFDDSTIGSTFLQGDGDDDADAMSLRTSPEVAQVLSGQAFNATRRRGLDAEGDYDGDTAYSGPGVLA